MKLGDCPPVSTTAASHVFPPPPREGQEASSLALLGPLLVRDRLGAVTAADPALRQRLYAAKLAALVRSHWGAVVDDATPIPFAGGAALSVPGVVWVLAEERAERSLGPALLLASRRATDQLHLLAGPPAAGSLARRATVFRLPTAVWTVEGRDVAEKGPDHVPQEPPLPDAAEPYRLLIRRAGAEPVVEAGILRAEVLGLEVGRVEVDEAGARLAVGVGKYDREAMRIVHGDDQGLPQLFEAVQFVSERRVPGGEGSPAYHLAPERWLRSLVVDQPHLVGAAELTPVPPPVVRGDLRETVPAPAAGTDQEGRRLLVLCSVGVDLDLVPTAADVWLADGRQPRLVLCVPEGDAYPALRELASLLHPPVQIVTVASAWRAGTEPAPPQPR